MSSLRIRPARTALRTHHGFVLAVGALAFCALIAGAAAAITALRSGPDVSGWTGVAVTVPACPADAHGCRLLVDDASGATSASAAAAAAAAHEDWSGAATTLKIVLPAGTYAVSAEGCYGYKIESVAATVTSGFHAAVKLGSNWEMPQFLGRTCPGFGSVPIYTSSSPAAG
jgi:hypothetical protein